jgi:hypothetical protein
MQRATLAGWKAGTVEKDAGTIDHPRLAARQFTIGKMIRMLLLGPTADTGIFLVLPLAGLQPSDRLGDPFLVVGVGKMGAEGAAAIIRPIGVNTRATRAIDAGPARGEPGKVTAKNLAVVGRITELDESAGEANQHFWHARQCMPAAGP